MSCRCGCSAEFGSAGAVYDEMILDKIAEHGVFLQAVLPDEGDADQSPFVYTVGLAGLETPHPEFITFGLPPTVAASWLNHLAIDEVINAGRRFRPGRLPGFWSGKLDAWLLQVADTTEHLAMSNRIFGSPFAPVDALQLVWPDAKNRFPWDPRYDLRRSAQPLLGPR